MPLTVDAAIPSALFAHVTAFAEAQSPAIAVSFPGIEFSPVDGEPYLQAQHLPNRTQNVFIGNQAPSQHVGLLQVSVMWPADNQGEIPAKDLAGALLQHFSKGTVLFIDGVNVRIEQKGWISPGLDEPDRLRVPCTIPYVCVA